MAGEDLVESARRLIDELEQSEPDAIRADLSERLRGWDPEPWIADRWRPRLDEFAGPDRSVVGIRQVGEVMARATLAGNRGQAYVSVIFDEIGKISGLSIDRDERDGGFGIIVGCTEEQRAELSSFYALLTDGPIGYEEGGSQPPSWPDPTYPTQLHLDIAVADLAEAERLVLDHGARKLAEFPAWRVYADPVGHPFCLYPELTQPTERIGTLTRVVVDCADPPVLARFWSAMLDMPRRVEDSPDRVVIARSDDTLPMIALQRVPDYRPPRWPDPDYPAQLHFDIGYDNRPQKERLALQLGATLLPPQGGSCPVYADPAGHPFCLCYKGE